MRERAIIAAIRTRGFTLLELMVALAIAASLLAVAPVAVVRAYETMQYRSAVKELIAGLKSARLLAMRKGHSVAFRIDPAAHRFGLDERLEKSLPAELEIRMMVADIEIDGQRGGVRFYPDGSSTGGSFEVLRPSGGGVRIDVDWLLGRFSQTIVDGS